MEVIYYVAASLDGFIAAPDGGIGWLAPFEGGAEDYGYGEFYASVDAVFMGRKTAEQSLTFGDWPYPCKPCWVFSRGRVTGLPDSVAVTARSPAEVVAEAGARGLRRAWLVGGGETAAAFRTAGLIGEYIVSVIPVLLGAGIPLAGARGPLEPLVLAGTQTFPSGIVQLRYRVPAGVSPG